MTLYDKLKQYNIYVMFDCFSATYKINILQEDSKKLFENLLEVLYEKLNEQASRKRMEEFVNSLSDRELVELQILSDRKIRGKY